MNRLAAAFAELDLPLLLASLCLVVISVLSIYSAGITAEGVLVSREYLKQLVWGLTGVALAIGISLLDHKRYKDYAPLFYLVILAILVYTRVFGRVVNGARAWIGIGEVGIQPSEFAKLATILLLARYLDSSEHDKGLRRLLVSFGIILLPVGLILSQPDFGTSLVFFPILLFMILVAGLDRRHILFILLTGGLTIMLTVIPLWETRVLPSPTGFLFVLYRMPYALLLLGALVLLLLLAGWGWSAYKKSYYYWMGYGFLVLVSSLGASLLSRAALKEYQVMRLMVFLDPDIDPRGSGWNIIQSITAIGSGGFFGKGYLQGTQSHSRYIPQQSTDFIFSIIAEEWGFLGGLLVFGLFLIILLRTVAIMRTARDHYALYVAAGIMGMFFFHFMINAGMAMGIMPITGIPLLFLSYGGSSLWAALGAVGVLLGISARRYR